MKRIRRFIGDVAASVFVGSLAAVAVFKVLRAKLAAPAQISPPVTQPRTELEQALRFGSAWPQTRPTDAQLEAMRVQLEQVFGRPVVFVHKSDEPACACPVCSSRRRASGPN